MKPFKISIAVCEYNPFHDGHALHLKKAKESSPDAVAVIMSGNFCQRGGAAIIDKYARARHAILNGADIVFELPTVFSVAPAEIFASGAIKLLDSLPGEKTLYFGTETGKKEDFLKIAEVTTVESKEFKEALKIQLSKGVPHAQARVEALKTVYPDLNFSVLENPNSVLGVEYAKALLKNRSKTEICPIERIGGYDDLSLKGEYCSAAAIRYAISDGKKKKLKGFVPSCVYEDLPDRLPSFDDLFLFRALEASKSELKEVVDCTEGLENRIKALAPSAKNLEDFIDKLETRRYTRARLRRILTANALKITKEFTEKCLKSNLYLKVLAIANDKINLLSDFSGCKNKLITRKSDADGLTGIKKACFLKDAYANDVYNLVTKQRTNEYQTLFVKR